MSETKQPDVKDNLDEKTVINDLNVHISGYVIDESDFHKFPKLTVTFVMLNKNGNPDKHAEFIKMLDDFTRNASKLLTKKGII